MSNNHSSKLTAIGHDLLERFKSMPDDERQEIINNLELEKYVGMLKEKGVQGFLANAGSRMGEEKKVLGEEGFWPAWGAKLLFTLISVKFWGLVGSLGVTSWLVLNKIIEPSQWVTFNSTVWGMIFGLKEIFKISEGRDKMEQKILEQTKRRL